MSKFKQQPMSWANEGNAPSSNLTQTGFQGGYKPPASVFNYHFHNTSQCLKELQQVVDQAFTDLNDMFIVELEIDDSYAITTAPNKTYTEIEKAIMEKKNVVCEVTLNGESIYLPLSSYYYNLICFIVCSLNESYEVTITKEGCFFTRQSAVGRTQNNEAVILNTDENIATGKRSLATGDNTSATGDQSASFNQGTSASGRCSFASGYFSTAGGLVAVANGTNLIANNFQTVFGKFNIEKSGPTSQNTAGNDDDSLFIIGNGTTTARSNACRLTSKGKMHLANGMGTTPADFAEFFEWADGNPDNEDRRGKFVTLEGNKIKLANADDYILGVVSVAPAIVGNSASEEWQGKYLTDNWGERLTQEVEVPERFDELTEKTIPAHKEIQYVVNPKFDPNQEYISREFRKEWAAIGMLGQLVVRDDNTCQVNGYCKPSADGIATATENGYRVMERIDDTFIKVLIK